MCQVRGGMQACSPGPAALGSHADRRHRSDTTLIAQSGMQMPSYRARASASAWPCGVEGNRRNGSLLDLLSLRPGSFGSPRPALHILLLPLARPSAAEDVLLEGGEAAWAVDCGPWLARSSNVHGPRTPVRPGGGVLSQLRNGSSRRSHGISHACLADGVPPGAVVPGEELGWRGRGTIFFRLLIKSHC